MTTCKVLLPLDGSGFSRQILAPIARLFPPDRYALVLLRVEQEPLPTILFGRRPASLIDAAWNAEEDLDHLPATCMLEDREVELTEEIHVLTDELAGYEAKVIVRFGDPAEAIVEVATQERVDLIAMATHGRTGLLRLLLGSVTEKVLRLANIPVLLLRPRVAVELVPLGEPGPAR